MRRSKRRRDEGRAQPLATRDNEIGGARSELSHGIEPAHERVELQKRFVHRAHDFGALPGSAQHRAGNIDVACAQPRGLSQAACDVADHRPPRYTEQRIRDTGHRRQHDHGRLGSMAHNQRDRVSNRGRIGQ